MRIYDDWGKMNGWFAFALLFLASIAGALLGFAIPQHLAEVPSELPTRYLIGMALGGAFVGFVLMWTVLSVLEARERKYCDRIQQQRIKERELQAQRELERKFPITLDD